MTTEADLAAVFETARAHLRPGGLALFVPDGTKESFRPATKWGGHDRGDRSMRYLQWDYDPDPDDTSYCTAFAYLFREGGEEVRMEQDHHVMGLFPEATWLRLIEGAGLAARAVPYEESSFDPPVTGKLFLGIRNA
jgi:hypothetical protein